MRLLALVLPPLALLLTAASAAAAGCPPTSCGVTGSAVPGSPLLVVRPRGDGGPLTVYDVLRRRARFTLPAGILSADGRSHYVARSARGRTTVRRFDAQTGAFAGTRSLRGRWNLAAVSANGNKVVLTWYERRSKTTRFRILGGARFALHGTYDVEAVSSGGRRVFLVHYLRSGYELERYDVGTRRLRANPPLEDGVPEKMTGSPWSAVATRDGRWLLTLYLKADGRAFVHALDLRGGPPHCIDLPGRGSFFQSTLALSPHERTLYVATAPLGQLVAVDLRALRVARTVRFARFGQQLSAGIGPNAAVSADGRRVAFTLGSHVWRLERGRLARRRASGDVQALAFAPDGRLLALVGWKLRAVR